MQTVSPIIHQVQQRTEEWHKLRLGVVTGSEASKTLSFSTSRYMPTKAMLEEAAFNHAELGTSEEKLAYLQEHSLAEYCLSAGVKVPELGERKTYRENKVGERLTGLPSDPEGYVSYDMKWGMINEDLARTVYQIQQRCLVEDGPFMQHPELKAGVSPDGISTDMTTGEIGLLEIKCLRSANHLFKVIAEEEMPLDYRDQVQMQMWIAGASWCDFVAYDSRLPEGLKIFVKRIEFDRQYVEYILEPGIRRFLKECDAKEKFFRLKIREGKNEKQSVGHSTSVEMVPEAEIILPPETSK